MPDVELARRPDVELVKTGSWATMTGSWNPTPEDLASAVEAQSCPGVRKPVVKLGHVDSRFDGEPAMGYFENLRLADGGTTLVGDQVTLPWLNSVQAAAYPSRSVEGNYNHTCGSGHKHKFVLTAVALLGITPPAVKTIRNLNDLPAMLGVAAAEGEVPEGAQHVQVTIQAATEVHTGAMIALIPTVEDAQRLTVDGGLPVEEIHLTLAYLGEAAELGATGQQDIIDAVSRAANGLPQLEADVFAAAVFNPGDTEPDRDTCLVHLISGALVDAVHDLVDEALMDVMWPMPLPIPEQHRPWFAHLTAIYTDDLGRLADLAANMGPIRFDRIRLAFAGQHVDIPLIPPDENADMQPVAASATDDIRTRIAGLRSARTAREPDVAASDAPPADPAAPEVTPPAEIPAPILPAAEPEPVNTDPKEDLVSTDLSAFRSRLGLSDDADESAITAAIDALKAKADTPAPSPEMVAASAAAEAEKSELQTTVSKLEERMTEISAELSAAKSAQAATVKASVFDAAVKEGKLKPADREQWEQDYDQAPGAITRVLASIAPGTAVPVMASGTAGKPEAEGSDSEWDDIVSRLDAPKAV